MFTAILGFLGILSRIPILGPIVDIIKGQQNLAAIKYKEDGTVDIAAVKASADVIAQTKDDIGTRLARDIVILPWAAYGGLSGWDYTVAKHWPSLVWNTTVVPPESGLQYLPYMVFVYLLGAAGFAIWKRR